MNGFSDQERVEATKRFLVQYAIRKRLESANGCPDEDASKTESSNREECANLVHPYDTEIAAGQIRMLNGTERPTYSLVARSWGANSWLVIPFSDFSDPAFETELKLRRDGGVGLRVAQLWNARSLARTTLARSWIAGKLDDSELQDVLSAWKWSVGSGELTRDQLGRTGAPILRRDDSRIAYQDSELRNFAALDAQDIQRMNWLEEVLPQISSWQSTPFRRSATFERVQVLAAAPVLEPVSADCRIDGFAGKVHVRYMPEDRTLRLQVFDERGMRANDLDDWFVVTKAEEPLGVISEGRFVHAFAEAFDGAVALVDGEKRLYPLVSTDRN